MTLSLAIIRSPSPVSPDRREIDRGPFTLGRSTDNDWVLPDPYRLMSRRHCVLSLSGATWTVIDLSANGTFVNDEAQPIGRDLGRPLMNGDRLRFGGYEVAVSIGVEEDDTLRGKNAVPLENTVVVRSSQLASPARTGAAGSGSADEVFADLTLQNERPDELLAAFLRGARVPQLVPADPVAAMQELGAAFRNLVAGLRQTLQARAAVKDEFRIEQTTVRARGNNPLKFSQDDEDALAVMLKLRRPNDMGAAAAVADALRDVRIHELASMTAMRDAVQALLTRLDPDKIGTNAEQGGFKLLGAQGKGRAWEAFEAAYRQLRADLADDFDSVFGKSFAEAYERAVRDIAAAERSG